MIKLKFLFVSLFVALSTIGCNNKKISFVILFTNDIHGQFAKEDYSLSKINYAHVGAMKQQLLDEGKKTFLFDVGDHLSGGIICTCDKGEPIIEIMNDADYDCAVFGNHEFDYDMEHLDKLVNSAKFPYISTNFYNYDPVKKVETIPFCKETSKVFTAGETKIGVIGVTTPSSITTSISSHFQNEKGEFIYSFLEDDKYYEIIQKEIDKLKNDYGCKYVFALAHLGNIDDKYSSSKLVNNTTGLTAVFDGHSHVVDKGTYYLNKNNEKVLVTQTGSHFKNIGKFTLYEDGTFNNNLINSYGKKLENICQKEEKVIEKLIQEFNVSIANTDIDFIATDDTKEKNWIVRSRETNLGDLCADSLFYCFNNGKVSGDSSCDLAIANSGGIRASIKSKVWSYASCRIVHSFDNNLCVKEILGSDIKLFLEFVTRKVGKVENLNISTGGFPQVAGISFSLDTNIKSDIVSDGSGFYVSGPTQGHERIKDLKVYNKQTKTYENIDLNKKYRVGASSFVLLNKGDGAAMFAKGSQAIKFFADDVFEYQMLAEYIKDFSIKEEGELPTICTECSPLNDNFYLLNYENPNGAGRINIIR